MYHIAVIEAEGGEIARRIKNTDILQSIRMTCINKVKALGKKYDFVVVAHELAKYKEWEDNDVSQCNILLVPGKYATRIAKVIKSKCVVGYGLSSKDTITLSSIEEGRAVLAIQREMITLDEKVLDRQEVPLEYSKLSTDLLMVLAGSLLILGMPPERLYNHTFLEST